MINKINHIDGFRSGLDIPSQVEEEQEFSDFEEA